MRTHYLPVFTETIGTRQRAACGELIDSRQHSAEPQCADCKAYVLAEPQTLDELEREKERLFG